MTLSAKFARKQLERFKPLMTESAIETARKGQEKLGELMTMTCKKTLTYASVSFEHFESAWAIPKDDTRDGVMLYPGPDDVYPSIRLAAVRDGIEDYERLDEAAKVFGRELVTKAVLKITPSVIEFDRSGEKLLKIRRELADRMEAKD